MLHRSLARFYSPACTANLHPRQTWSHRLLLCAPCLLLRHDGGTPCNHQRGPNRFLPTLHKEEHSITTRRATESSIGTCTAEMGAAIVINSTLNPRSAAQRCYMSRKNARSKAIECGQGIEPVAMLILMSAGTSWPGTSGLRRCASVKSRGGWLALVAALCCAQHTGMCMRKGGRKRTSSAC